jgi:hypothetical protein
VSTIVGSVNELISGIEGCKLVEAELDSVTDGLISCIKYSIENGITEGRDHIKNNHLGLKQIATNIQSIYQNALNK